MRGFVHIVDIRHADFCTPVILSLQTSSGCFAGDRFGETDTRFTFCSIAALSLLNRLSYLSPENTERAVDHIRRCRNFDGGFGSSEGAESHAGQGKPSARLNVEDIRVEQSPPKVFVCVGALAILDRLEEVDIPTLAWWLAERQLPNGGLNGRPEKLEDVRFRVCCY